MNWSQPPTSLSLPPPGLPPRALPLTASGFPEFWYSWRHALAAFCDDYDAVALDMRGYGQSDKPQGVDDYLPDRLVSWQAVAMGSSSSRQAVVGGIRRAGGSRRVDKRAVAGGR